jgi:predicted ATPase with chaperone activity
VVARVNTVAFQGIEAVPVEAQVTIASGLPAFTVVGLPDKAVGESRERVRAALSGMGLALPAKCITVNLAPADLLKEGSHFDLPIALGLLAAMGVLPAEEIEGYVALGELSLDGSLQPVAGVLPAALGAAAQGKGLICPSVLGGEAAWAGGIEVLAAPALLAIVNHFKGSQILPPPEPKLAPLAPATLDLKDIKGQETAKRALDVAASGGHNLLMIGPPGAGKSMLAQRLPGLLPPLDASEALEVSMIHSVAGLLREGKLMRERPFRDPHHSASLPALVGGGLRGKAPKCALDYQSRISGPLFDRIDLHIDVPAVKAADLSLPPPAEGSAEMAARVKRARQIQAARYAKLPKEKRIRTNAELDGTLLDELASPDAEGRKLLNEASERLHLSARGYHRVLRVARTLADLDASDGLRRIHLAEALSYRRILLGEALR